MTSTDSALRGDIQLEASDRPGSDPKRFRALAVIAIAQLMVVLDASVVVVALPSAQHALHISVANRQWVMSAYTLAFGSLLLLGGRIADFLGRRRMFVMGLAGFAVASALGGLAQTPAMLFGARALQGAFAALMAPAALSLLTVTFTEPRERARAFGLYGAVAGSGAAIGLVLGGTLTQLVSWRWTLLINVPIALAAAVAALRVVRESRGGSGTGYDVPGATAATGGLFLLVYGFTTAGTDGWSSPLTLALLAGAVIVLSVFVFIEIRSSSPLLPLRVVLDRNRGGSFLASLLVGSAMLGSFLLLTYYFQGTLHYSVLKTGFAFLPFSGGVITGATLASRLLPKLGPRVLMAIGLIMGSAGAFWFTQLGVGSSYAMHVLPAEIILSIGMGLAFVTMSNTALIGVDPRDAGVASALVNTTQQAGGSLGIALLNTIATSAAATFLASHGRSLATVRAATVHGYTVAFAVSASLLLVAAGLVIFLVRAARESVAADASTAQAPPTDATQTLPIDAGQAESLDPRAAVNAGAQAGSTDGDDGIPDDAREPVPAAG